MTAKNQDFVVKNGLQVTSNLVVGAYTGTASSQQINNGAIISGAVGIGTSTVIAGTQLQVAGGNLRIASAGTGIYFPDGTRQTTAATNTPSYGYQYTLQFAGAGNTFSGDSSKLVWNSSNATLLTNNIAVANQASVGSDLYVGGNFTVGGQVNFANVGGIQNLVVASLTSNTYVQAATTIKGNNIVANVNIGIGTAVTTYPLDVYGNIHIGNTATASGLIFSDGTIQQTAATNTPSFGPAGTVQFAGAANAFSGNTAGFFWDNSLSQLDVDKLQVNNGATVASLNSNTNVVATNIQSTGAATVASLNSNTNVVATNIQSTDAATVNTLISNVYGLFGQNVTVNSANTSTTTGTGALVVTGGVGIGGNINVDGLNSLFTNSVGIGTSSTTGMSSSAVAIYGAAKLAGNLNLANTAAISGITFADGSFQTTAAVSASGQYSSGSPGYVQFAGSANSFASSGNLFFDSTTQRLGIGTTAPIKTLDVRGNVYLQGNAHIVYGQVGIGTSTVKPGDNLTVVSGNINVASMGTGIFFPDGSFQQSSAGSSAAGTDKTIQFNDGGLFAGQNNFIFDKVNLRLGIGTTSLNNSLAIYSATPALFNTTNGSDQQIIVGNTTTDGITLGYNSSSGTGVNTYGYISAVGAASKNISVTKNGTGIGGITIPQNTLDIGGGTAIGFAYAGVYGAPSQGAIIQGSVGIGTYTPRSTLDVNGWVGIQQGLSVANTTTVSSLVSNAGISASTLNISGVLRSGSIINNTNITTATLNSTGAATVASLNSNTNVVATNIQSTDAATVASLNSNTNVVATNIQSTGAATVASLVANANTTTATLNTTGAAIVNSLNSNTNVVATNIQSTGAATVASLVANANTTTATLNSTGAAIVNSLNSNTNVVATNLQSTGQASVASLVANANTTTATLNSTGAAIVNSLNSNTNVVATNLQSTGQATVASLVANTNIFSATLNTSGLAQVSSLIGNNNIYGATLQSAGIARVNSIISNTNITTATINSTGAAIVNALNSNTNVVATNIQSTGQATVASLVANANIFGATLNTSGLAQNASLITNANTTTATLNTTGQAQVNSFIANTSIFGASLNISGDATVNRIVSNAGIYSANLNILGTAQVGALISNSTIQSIGVATVNGLISNTNTTTATLNTTGLATVNQLVSNANIYGANLNIAGTSYVGSLIGNNNVYGATLQSAGLATVNQLVSNANIYGANINIAGAALVGSLNSNTNVVATNIQSTGQATVASLVANANIFGATLNTSGLAQHASLITNANTTTATLNSSGLAQLNSLVANTTIQSGGQALLNSLVVNVNTTTTTLNVSQQANVALLISNTNITTATLNTTGLTQLASLITNANTTTATLNSTGAAIVNSLNSNTNVVATNLQSTGQATVASLVVNANTTSATLNVTGAAQVNSLASNGAVSGTAGTFTGALYGGSFNTAGTATVNALISNTNIFGATLNTSGLAQFANVVSNGDVKTATVNASSTIVGANIYSNGFVQAAGTVTAALINSNGAIVGGSITSNGNVQSAGIVISNSIIANANIFGATLNTSGTAQFANVVSNGDVKTATVNASSAIVGQNITSNSTIQAAGTATVNALISNTNIFGATLNTSGAVVVGSLTSNTTIQSNGAAVFSNFTSNTRSFITSGGMSITGDSLVTGNLTITGNLVFGGNTFVINTQSLTIVDPVIELGIGTGNTPLIADDGFDRGLLLDYYHTPGYYGETAGFNHAFVGYNNSTGRLIYVTNVAPGNLNVNNDIESYPGIIYGGATFGNIWLSNNIVSTDTQSGGVVAIGGIGAGGNINVGGQRSTFAGNIFVNGTNASISPTTGAIIVTGGVGVNGNINAGGNVFVGASLTAAGQAIAANIYSNGFVQAAGPVTAASINSNGAIVGASINSNGAIQASATLTAANVVSNADVKTATLNASSTIVAANIYSNGFVQSLGPVTAASVNSNGTVVGANIYSNGFVQGGAFTAASLNSNGTVVGANIYSNGFIQAAGTVTVNSLVANLNVFSATLNTSGLAQHANIVSNGYVQATGTVNAGSINSNGAIVGSAINSNGAIQAAGTVTAANINSNGFVQTAGTVTANTLISNVYGLFGQNVTVNSTNASTAYTAGALLVAGGVGIAGNINVNGANNLFTNKVGIGTSTVAGARANVLSVYGTENIFGNLIIANTAAGGSGIYFPDGTYQQTAGTIGGVNQSVQYNNNGVFGGDADFIFDNVNNRLGIGTTSLTNSLMVFSATPALFNTTNGADQQIIVGNAAATGAVVGFNSSTGTGVNTYGYFSFAGAASKNISVISGKTGIGGVTIPQNTLEIGGTTIIGGTFSGNNNFINPPSNGLAVQGSVGIGTFTPLSTLDVNGIVSARTAFSTAGTAFVSALIANNNVFGATLNTSGLAQLNSLIANTNITTSTLNATSNVIVASLNSNTNVVATNVQSTGLASVASLIANTNIFGATLNTSGLAQFANAISNGFITSGSLNSIGLTQTANLISNGYITTATLNSTGAAQVASLISNANIYGATLNTGGLAQLASLIVNVNTTTATLNVTGAAQVNSLISNAGVYSANLNIAGAALVNSLNSNTNVVATNLQSTGQATVASLVSNGAVSGTTGTFTGALYGGSFNTAGTATVNALVSNGAISGTTVTGTAGTFTSIQNSGNERSANIVSNTWIHATQNLTVASSNTSTSTTTGALVVAGGIGVAGNVYASGNVVAASFQPTSASIPGAGLYLPTTNAVAVSTAANERIRVHASGGVSINTTTDPDVGNLLINGQLFVGPLTDSKTVQSFFSSVGLLNNAYYANLGGSGIVRKSAARGIALIAVDYNNGIIFNSAIAGGVDNTLISNPERMRVDLTGNVGIINSTSIAGYAVAGLINSNTTIQAAGTATVNALISNGAITATTITGTAGTFTSLQNSGTTTTNALVSNVYGLFGQNVVVNSTNASISTTTGALVVAGGAGIGGNINVGGANSYFSGNIGIGVTPPLSKLHVEGTTSGNGAGPDAIAYFKQNGTWSGSEPWALYVDGYSYLNGFRINAADGVRSLYKTATGGTLGFATAGDDPITFTQLDNTERMRIAAGGFVGIGSTIPATNLDVYYAGGQSRFGGASGNNTLQVYSSGGTIGLWAGGTSYIYSNGELLFKVGATTSTSTPTSGTDAVTITNIGRVGIGVSPSSLLDVNGVASFRSVMSVAGTATVNTLVSNVYGVFGQNVTVNSANASTSTTTGALVVAGGAGIAGNINVGGNITTTGTSGNISGVNNISTVSLTASGNINISGSRNLFANSVGIGTSTATGINSNVFTVYGTAMYYGNIVLQNRAAGGAGIYFADGTFQTTASTGGGGTGNYSNANVASYLSGPVQVGNLTINNTTASTSTVTGALLMGGGAGIAGNINVGGVQSLFAGSVGIGTNSAFRTLHVRSSGLVSTLLETISTSSYLDISDSNSNLLRIGSFQGTTGLASGATTTAQVTLTPGGSVGIGTTSPVGRLQVAGNVFLPYNTDSELSFRFDSAYQFGMKNTTADPRALRIFSRAADNDGRIVFATGNDVERMRLDAAGNLGLGITPGAWGSAWAAIQIKDSVSLWGATNSGAYLSNNLYFDGAARRRSYAGVSSEYVQLSGSHIWYTAGSGAAGSIITFTQAMTLDASGNLGIGSTSPTQAKLVIGGSGANRVAFGGPTGTLYVGYDGATDALQVASNSAIIFQSGASYPERMRIDANGNVGIATTSVSAGYKLQVNGGFAAITKSFVIDHPTKTGMKLRYGSLEGPENGVYVRGRLTNTNTIVLPDYWTGLVDENSITVNLTAIGTKQNLWVEDIVDNTVTVGGKNVNCFYTVFATRKDVGNLVVEF